MFTYQKNRIKFIENEINILFEIPLLYQFFFNSIIQNLDGNEIKKKIRLRWYGSDCIIKNLFLEIKSKKGMVTQKKKID